MGTVSSSQLEEFFIEHKDEQSFKKVMTNLVPLVSHTLWCLMLKSLVQDYCISYNPQPIIRFFEEDFPYDDRIKLVALSLCPRQKPQHSRRPIRRCRTVSIG